MAKYIPRNCWKIQDTSAHLCGRIQPAAIPFAPAPPMWKCGCITKWIFPDPILYAHLTDTMNGQIHILLYILNDPDSPRFDVDKMPDGTPTKFGILKRNVEAEIKAMRSRAGSRSGAARA
jgi:hypothetical protein